MSQVHTATFTGVRYDIDIDPNLGGYCDRPDKKGRPCLTVITPLNTKKGLIHLIHECLHASQYFKDHAIIERTSTEIGTLMWRLGYRRPSPGQEGSTER